MTLKEALTHKLLADADRLMAGVSAAGMLSAAGKRKSRQKGSSLDFSDFRAYTQGDDARKIDWRGYAKNEKANIKLYNEEKQTCVNFIIDFSRSMDYGDGRENKLFYSSLAACLIAYCFLKGGDRVGIYFMADRLKAAGDAVTSPAGFSGLVSAADRLLEEEKSIEESFDLSSVERGGLCFVFSDFYSENGYKELIKRLNQREQRGVLVHILTQREIRPSLKGAYTLTDLESGHKKSVFSGDGTDNEYEKLVNMHKNEIKKYSTKRNVIYFDFSTDINILDCVFKILKRI